MKISIIGLGSWPLAIANTLCDNGHDVLMWSKIEEEVCEFNEHATAKKYLPQIVFPNNIKSTTNIASLLEHSDIIIVGVPTKFYRAVLDEVKDHLNSAKIFVNISKGIEPKTQKLISEIIYDTFDIKYIQDIVNLSGPSHAEELVLGKLTTLVSSSKNIEMAYKIQDLFNCDYLRVYATTDIIGTQILGALKNVIAIASGIITGLEIGDNAKAALITRGLVEMRRYALHKGALEKTVYGLAGLGDLIVTTSSPHSRNFQAGYRIGKGEDPKQSLENSVMVVEGIRTCRAVVEELEVLDFEMPITKALYDVFYNDVQINDAILDLMRRTTREEWSD